MTNARRIVTGLGVAALCTVAAPRFEAQSSVPPRPAVQISKLPTYSDNAWPADFNGDGRTDLIGSPLAVQLGRGDGTFGPPSFLDVPATPKGVGDFNNDRKIDVVVSGVAILPGRGDGTFAAPRPVTGPPAPELATGLPDSNAVVADFNNDGNRDLVLLSATSLDIHPGNGDFTFAPKMSLPLDGDGEVAPQAVAADFNGDGRRDIAATSNNGVVVFLNRGGLVFGVSTITSPARLLWDITAGDLNGDTRADLIAVSTDFGSQSYAPGQVFTMLGNGNGTFQPVVAHDTGQPGSLTVVVGDFNADRRLDIATGNQSSLMEDELRFFFHYWDSVTFLAGRGDGTFASPASFSLDYATGFAKEDFANRHSELNTSDVNGDGRTDLIASPGALILTLPARSNRPPTVNAGPDFPTDGDGFACFTPLLFDPDFDVISVLIDISGFPVGFPDACVHQLGGPVTIRVSDGRGGEASDTVRVVGVNRDPFLGVTEPDEGETVPRNSRFTIAWDVGLTEDSPTIARFRVEWSPNNGQTFTSIAGCSNLPADARRCEWATPATTTNNARVRVIADGTSGELVRLNNSERFSIVAGPRTSLPDGWSQFDVGAITTAGDGTFDGSTFTVTGSGADIWNSRDEFHFVSHERRGDFDFSARVTSVENINQWTKAGLMVRNSTAFPTGTAHASIFATPSTVKGVSVQLRNSNGGTSSEAARLALAPPVWLKLMRRGTSVTFAYRKAATDPWTQIRTVGVALADPVLVGFAVSSHIDGQLATATFDNASVTEVPAWTNQDIGAVALPGREAPSSDLTRTTIEGSGADIWGTADAFHFRYIPWNGDATITARLLDIENTHAWAKAGVMFRESTAPGSKHIMAIVSPGKGVAVQYRAATGGATANARLAAGTAPRWLRLTRINNTFTAASSSDGLTWTTLASTTVEMSTGILVGLPVTSHNAGALATAAFDEIALVR